MHVLTLAAVLVMLTQSARVDALMPVWMRRPIAAVGVSATLGLAGMLPANAAIDCNKDCFKNCSRVAPGSTEYCTMSCSEYCSQDDREDGLSGSVSSKGGETGIFGGSIDGTVTRKDDQPPKLIELIPKSMLPKGKIRSN